MKWFNSLPRLVQFILLLIPGVNWIVEIVVRLTALISKPDGKHILGFILYLLPVGVVLAYVDFVWVLLYKHLILAAKVKNPVCSSLSWNKGRKTTPVFILRYFQIQRCAFDTPHLFEEDADRAVS